MGKQKYPQTAGGVTVDGEKKQRDHSKTGKLQKRREQRYLEAVARQVANVQTLERALEKAKDKAPVQEALLHAQLTLKKIRGGKPHSVLDHKYKTATTKETNEKVTS